MTGVTLAGPDESAFVGVHNDGYLGGDDAKRTLLTPEAAAGQKNDTTDRGGQGHRRL